jgi:hypothetical protein
MERGLAGIMGARYEASEGRRLNEGNAGFCFPLFPPTPGREGLNGKSCVKNQGRAFDHLVALPDKISDTRRNL